MRIIGRGSRGGKRRTRGVGKEVRDRNGEKG